MTGASLSLCLPVHSHAADCQRGSSVIGGLAQAHARVDALQLPKLGHLLVDVGTEDQNSVTAYSKYCCSKTSALCWLCIPRSAHWELQISVQCKTALPLYTWQTSNWVCHDRDLTALNIVTLTIALKWDNTVQDWS